MSPLLSEPNSSCGSSSHEMIPSCQALVSEVMTASMKDDPTDKLNMGSLQRLLAKITLFLRADSSIYSPHAHVEWELQRVLLEFISPVMVAVERWDPTRGVRVWAGMVDTLVAFRGLRFAGCPSHPPP